MRSTWIALMAMALLGGCSAAPPSAVRPKGSIATEVVPSAAPGTPAIASSSPSALAEPTTRVDEPWIAYQWVRAGGDGIYLVRPDGTNPHELLPDAKYSASHPDWSPDGARIAFDAGTHRGFEIWVVNADGTNAAAIVRRSTDCAISCGEVAEPGWSPDGSKIAFVRFQLGASPQGRPVRISAPAPRPER